MSEQNMCQLLAAARAYSVLFSRLLRTALNVLCLKKSTPSFCQSPQRHRRHLRVTVLVFFTRSILHLYIIVVPRGFRSAGRSTKEKTFRETRPFFSLSNASCHSLASDRDIASAWLVGSRYFAASVKCTDSALKKQSEANALTS